MTFLKTTSGTSTAKNCIGNRTCIENRSSIGRGNHVTGIRTEGSIYRIENKSFVRSKEKRCQKKAKTLTEESKNIDRRKQKGRRSTLPLLISSSRKSSLLPVESISKASRRLKKKMRDLFRMEKRMKNIPENLQETFGDVCFQKQVNVWNKCSEPMLRMGDRSHRQPERLKQWRLLERLEQMGMR